MKPLLRRGRGPVVPADNSSDCLWSFVAFVEKSMDDAVLEHWVALLRSAMPLATEGTQECYSKN